MKRKSNFKFVLFPIITALIGSLLPNAFSVWAGGDKKDISVSKNTGSVCYIDDPKYSFPTIEAAVEAANNDQNNNSIYVIPGEAGANRNFVHIKKSITLKTGNSLILPYDNEGSTNNGSSYADYSSTNDFVYRDTHCVTTVLVDNNVTITLEGASLIVGGITGCVGQKTIGKTSSYFTEIILGSNSRIVANSDSNSSTKSKLEVYGYIRRSEEDFNINNYSSSRVVLNNCDVLVPAVIYDFKGGTKTTKMVGENVFPFSLFDFPNLEVCTEVHQASTIKAQIKLEATGLGSQVIDFAFISNSNSLFTLDSASAYFEIIYIPEYYAKPTMDYFTSNSETIINVYGAVSFYQVTIKVGSGILATTIKSEEYFVPISYKLKVNVKSGASFTMKNNVKLMPGAEIIVEKGATVTCNAGKSILILPLNGLTDVDYGYPYNRFSSPGKIVINGTANINGAAYGKLHTTTSEALINIANNFGSLTYKEFVNMDTTGNYTIDSLYGDTLINDQIVEATFFKGSFKSLQKVNTNIFYWQFPDAFVNTPTLTRTSGTGTEISPTEQTNVELTASCSLWFPASNKIIYTLYKSNDGTNYAIVETKAATLETSQTFNVTFDAVEATTETFYKVRVALENNESRYSESSTIKFTQTVDSGGSGDCLLPDTKVLLSNGQTKFAKDLDINDRLLTFDHSTGKFVERQLIVNVYIESQLYNIITLNFDNGKTLKIATGHGLFNVDKGTYEIYYGEQFFDHIGETFLSVDYNNGCPILEKTKLVGVKITKEYTPKYSPLTQYDINCVADGMLTIPDNIEGMLDSFTYKSDFTYDLEALQADIDKYGIYNYEDVKDVFHPYLYDIFNFKYWRAFIKKGTLTYDKVNGWIEKYMDQIVAFNNLDWDTSKQIPLGPQHG